MPNLEIPKLGDFIREQRETAKISLRELAKSAGVSNPYLSQIERGLRKPSAEILQQIAKGLRISAEALYVQAGILDKRDASPVVDGILADETLTERQRQVLLEIYDSFRRENAAAALAAAPAESPSTTTPEPTLAPVLKAPRKKASAPKAAPAVVVDAAVGVVVDETPISTTP
jgi:transcriptional regulator with XRE-family HTH domain